MSRDGVAVRACRALVRLYPRRFRDDYGVDMVLLVREQAREEPAWRVLGRLVIDGAISIPSQHLEVRMRRVPSSLVPVVYLTIAAAGLLLAVVGGSTVPTLLIGLGVAAIAGTIGALAWKRSTPVAGATTLAGAWWKFLLSGPALIAVVIVAAGVGVQAWYLGLLAVLLACGSTALGLVLGAVRLVGRGARGNPM